MSQVIWSNPYLYIDLIINWQKLHSACLSSEFRWWFVFMSLSPSVDLIKLYTSKVTSASNPGGLTTQTGAIANVFSVANACFLSLSAFYTVSQLFWNWGCKLFSLIITCSFKCSELVKGKFICRAQFIHKAIQSALQIHKITRRQIKSLKH